MSRMAMWAVRALRLPSRRLWGCLGDWQHWGDRGFTAFNITVRCDICISTSHSFLSVLLFPHSFTLHCSLSDTGSSSPKIPSQQFHLALVLILRELSSFKTRFGMKNMEKFTFRGTALFRNQFALIDSSKVKETMLSFSGILQFTCCVSHEERAPWKTL